MADYDESTYGERIAEVYDSLNQSIRYDDHGARFLAPLAKGRRVSNSASALGESRFRSRSAASEARRRRSAGDGREVARQTRRRADSGRDGQLRQSEKRRTLLADLCRLQHLLRILAQEDQVRCFTRVAKRLTPDGACVLEAFVPDLTRYDHAAGTATHADSRRTYLMEVSHVNVATQRVRAQ